MSTEHTLPFRAVRQPEKITETWFITNEDGLDIIASDINSEDRANFIVRACNNFDDLLAAGEGLLQLCKAECDGVWEGEKAWEEAKQVEAAIVAAKGGAK